jgi:hypothetical protein
MDSTSDLWSQMGGMRAMGTSDANSSLGSPILGIL